MVSNAILGLLMDVSELTSRLDVVVEREMKKRGYRGGTGTDLMIAVRSARRDAAESVKDEGISDLGAYMVKSLSNEPMESEGFDALLMSYEVVHTLELTDRMYVMSGRNVETDQVYVDYLLSTFKGKLSIEQAETLGLMLESYVSRVREDALVG